MIFPTDFVIFLSLVWQCAIAPRGATAAMEIPWNNGILKAVIYDGTIGHHIKNPHVQLQIFS